MKTYSRKNSSYLKKAFIASNFNEMCRLCLSEVDMVLTPIIRDCKISYQEWIHYSVDVLVEEGDGLPPNICEACLGMVKQTYLFKKKCKASDLKLREHLELLELNEEYKLNSIGFNLDSDTYDLFNKNELNQKTCNKSSAIDSGGTDEAMSNLGEEKKKEELPLQVSENELKNKTQINEVNIVKNFDSEKSTKKLVINEVKRFILKGEKKDGEQEEDLTECEVVPLEIQSEESFEACGEPKSLTNFNCDIRGEEDNTINEQSFVILKEKPDMKIEEIYKLWDNEEEEKEEEEEDEDEEICENDFKEKTLILSNTVGINSSKENENKLKTELLGLNSVMQMHRVYTNKNHIEIIETVPLCNRIKCFVCSEYFPTHTLFKDHLFKNHKEVSHLPVCEICGKNFTCTNSLKRHMSVHTGLKPYKCKICGRKFSQGSILKRHILTHESLKPFNCHICQKSYTQKMNLLSHLKHHGFRTGAESFKCELCKKTFVHQSGLSRHVKLHKGVRCLCTYCKKSFGDTSALVRHVKVMHQQHT